MRTFIALELPPELRSAVGELSAALQSRLPEMKWVKPNLVHLTLRFLGEIEPVRIDSLNEVVAAAAGEFAPFELSVTEVGHFGPAHSPRVLWMGLAPNGNLSSLAAALEMSFESAGFGRADKPFRAHLTLARTGRKPGPPPDWEAVARDCSFQWPHWSVGRVCVIRSTLTPRGPIYKTLSTHELMG
jgi:RNA 2',3'-cyclic 3'-phosphodiesterase